MRIFIQSMSADEIHEASERGFMDGVTLPVAELVSETEVGAEVASIRVQLSEIAKEFATPICVPIPAFSEGDIYRDARELARVSDNVIVQIPFLEDALVPIRKLAADGVTVCVTHVYNGAQAFLAAKIGASMVSVPVGDLEGHGQRSVQVVSEIRDVIDQSDMECDLAVAGPRSSNHFTECLLAGADVVCVTPTTLASLLVHALTDRGVDRFLGALSRRRKPRSS